MPPATTSLTDWLRRVPLSAKILIANSLILAIGAVGGTYVTVSHVAKSPTSYRFELIALFVAAGLAVSFAVNYLVLRVALTPLKRLQVAFDRVRAGEPAEVDVGQLDDAQFVRLIETFNQMLTQMDVNTQELRGLSQRMLTAQEDERQRVARELHDQSGQSLTTMLVHLRMLERSKDATQALAEVKQLRELTAQALEEIRRIALELRPKILEDLGLCEALAWRADELNASGTVHVGLQFSGMEHRLTPELELVLYRVAQEALTNVTRHANARNATIALEHRGSSVTLTISDDGTGFDVAALDHAAGLGLAGMRERLALVGGGLQVRSAQGMGTKLTATAPFD